MRNSDPDAAVYWLCLLYTSNWRNEAMTDYYGKHSVIVLPR